jgi:hypothetical protein
MVKIICLANSKKNGDRCIAGIDIDTGRWVRPIYTNSTNPKDGRIPREIRLINGEEVKLLDVIDIPLHKTGEDFGFESENFNILPGQWKKIREVSPNELYKFLDNRFILHNCIKYITVPFLQSLPFEQRKTIQLVYTQKLQTTRSNDNWKGSIDNDVNSKLKEASITDPEFINKLNSGYKPGNPCLVTVSLSMPWRPPDWEGEDPCWKLIAGVVELP